MEMPEVVWDIIPNGAAAEYSDMSAIRGHLGVHPKITLNYWRVKHPIYTFECLVHELIHFFDRVCPSWLEKLIDTSIDVLERKKAVEWKCLS